MNTHDVSVELGRLAEADVNAFERADLDAAVATSGRVRAWLDGFDVRCARRSRELASTGQAAAPESTLTNRGRRSGREAAAVTSREAVCESMPSFEEALGSGAVSAGHVDALARAAGRLDESTRAEFVATEAELLAAAQRERVETFERRCSEAARRLAAKRAGSDADELDRQRAQSNAKWWVDKITGMCHTHLELDPLRHAALWSAVNARLARNRAADGNAGIPWQQLKVDAFVGAVGTLAATATTGNAPGTATGTATDAAPGDATDAAPGDALDRVPEATLLIDLTTLVDGFHDRTMCELEDGTPIPLSTMRRLLCDCEVLPVVLGGNGEVLDEGRSRRTASRAQRRALRAMHRTCAHPDCRVTFADCRIHHIRWWWRHTGPTDIDNLLPLCERHHHLVHEGGWQLTMTPDRIATWTRPDGSRAHIGSTVDRAPDGVRPPRDRAARRPGRTTGRDP